MPKVPSTAVRRMLIERAAEMLARREPVTLRSVVAGTGASTMAVYTHFDGMPGLWRAVRQEGFTRLATELGAVQPTGDPVRDLVAYGAAFMSNALAHPALYRAMFDAGFDLEDPAAANASFEVLVSCAARARDGGRFAPHTDPGAVATRFWAFGHGLAMLVLTGVLPVDVLDDHVVPVATAMFVAAGDEEARCRRSARAGWLKTQGGRSTRRSR
ncbi:MAG: TetR/AcrR family transcriptional regulator [Ilumatobacteraceae bacterium]